MAVIDSGNTEFKTVFIAAQTTHFIAQRLLFHGSGDLFKLVLDGSLKIP